MKRFTDTAKWNKHWFKSLKPKMKLLWLYMVDECDNAGVWEVDLKVASLRIGARVNYDEAFEALGCQIHPMGKSRWFIKDFVQFQYGVLKAANPFHRSVISLLGKYGIEIKEGLPRAFDGSQYIYQEKEEDKEREKDNSPPKKFDSTISIPDKSPPTRDDLIEAILNDEIYIQNLQMVHRGKDIVKAFNEMYLHHSSSPSPPTEVGEWKQKLNTWLINTRNGTSKTARTESTNSRREGFAKRHSSDTGG